MYMCALAVNRRKRGLNAIALNGGAIIGAGYITRETDRALDLTMEKMALMRLSEEDFHQMIAEAIESGRVGCPDGAEITTGLLDIAPDSPNIPKWYRNPKFSRFIVQQSASNEGREEQTAAASIQDQLQACTTRHGLVLLVEQSFGSQLRKLLLTPADVSDEEILSKRSADLGLDSLIAVDLRSWLMKNFKVSIPVLKIMGSDTMASLVQAVVEDIPAEIVPNVPAASKDDMKDNFSSTTKSVASDTESGVLTPATPRSPVPIDWEAETTPPADDLADMSFSTTPPPATPPRVIVVTGVTGHLGHHLLEHLLSDTAAEEIHCLAVRRLASRLQDKELLTDPRIHYHGGDLSDDLLGLTEASARSIFARADAVIHNGADTSHVKPYRDLRAANVGSTAALARLCLPRRVPLHYISSAGVCIYHGGDPFPAVPVTAGPGSVPPPPDGSFGYACSKWASERLLERAHARHRLPVCIYRPSTVVRQGADAAAARAGLDWVNALLRYSRALGAAPRVSHNRGALDLVRAETCCAGVIGRVSAGRFLTTPGAPTAAAVEYVNLVGDAVVPLERLRDMDADQGRRYDVLPLDEWVGRAVEAGLHPGVAHLIREMDAPGRPDYPRLSRDTK